jgi:hypothetical protein
MISIFIWYFILEENQLYGQFEMFLEHVRYLDNIYISSIIEGFENILLINIAFWVNIDANEFVVKTIKDGYVISCVSNPPHLVFEKQ